MTGISICKQALINLPIYSGIFCLTKYDRLCRDIDTTAAIRIIYNIYARIFEGRFLTAM